MEPGQKSLEGYYRPAWSQDLFISAERDAQFPNLILYLLGGGNSGFNFGIYAMYENR